MTNKDFLIDSMHAHISYVDRKTVEVIFDIINKKDWAVFCSQMGDYDHPYERVQAEKEMEEALDKEAHPFGTLSYAVLEAIDVIKKDLTYDSCKESSFYRKHFHDMEEEYKGV